MEQFLPLIGGERALHRSIFQLVPKEYAEGYRIETALNYACTVRGQSILPIALRGTALRTHAEKRGVLEAPAHYLTLAHHMVDAAVRLRVGRMLGHFPSV
jgi:hypothetical protein